MASNAIGGDEILVNTVTGGDQEMSAVVALKNGGWLVSWEGSGTGDPDGIYQRRFNANGVAVGAATLVNATTAHDQFSTSVAALKDGGWLVSWTGEAGDFSNDVYLQRYSSSGKIVLAETMVNATTAGRQESSTITGLTDGGWVVTWNGDGAGGSSDIYQRRYDASGATDGADILVNSTSTTGDQYNTSVISLADGGWVIGWYGAGPGDSNGIFEQRYDKNGAAVDGPALVNTSTDLSQYSPAMAALNDRGWIVAWYGYGAADTSSTGVYMRHYDSKGQALGKTETLVNTVTDATQSSPSVTALSDGGWLVTWQSPDKNQQSVYDIYQQRYDGGGHKIGTQTLVNTSVNASQELPHVTAFANGGWLVSWEGAGKGDTSGIYQRHFAADVVGGAKADKLSGTSWGELLLGNAGNDKITARDGDDFLTGGKGNDKLDGGAGIDTFLFRKGDGADIITGFVGKGADHDLIDLSNVKGISSFADLKAHHMEHDATSVTVDYTAHDSITLAGVNIKSLSAADFLL
jgi:hypothetical protein